MTKEEREVMRMALEAMNLASGNLCETLNHSKKLQHKIGEPCPAVAKFDAAITAIEKCLANDTSQERVDKTEKQRHWVELTDDEISACSKGNMTRSGFARTIEAKLREKNT